jgi:hypothetical protein
MRARHIVFAVALVACAALAVAAQADTVARKRALYDALFPDGGVPSVCVF